MVSVRELQRIYFGAIAHRYSCSFSEAQRVAVGVKQLEKIGFTSKQIVFVLSITPRH